MRKSIIICMTALLGLSFFSDDLYGIPAFARKYKMSCQTCHSPFPKLKPYGDEFAGNGFVLAEQDAPRYYVDTGDPELSLIRDIPLAIRLEGFLTYNNRHSKRSDFSAPYNLKLLSGGAITEDIAYYFYFFFSERGEVAGVEDAFLMFNNVFDSELDIYVGQFQVSDPLFKRELRLTFEDYSIYKTSVGLSTANLAYDRGIMLTYGFETGTDIIVEVLNGTGLGHANIFRIFDKDRHKNVMGRVSQDVGEFVRIGAFGYLGKEELTNNAGTVTTNKIQIFGPDMSLSYKGIIELNLQYVQREDKDVFLAETDLTTAPSIETKGMMAELVYQPDADESKWYAVGMFNWVDSDQDNLDYKSGTFHIGYMLKRNIRMAAEYTYDFLHNYGTASIGFVTAF